MAQRRSDVSAVRAWWRGREHVRGAIVAQGSGALRVSGQREGDGWVLIVGVETQPLPSVAHVCRPRVAGVRRAGGAAVVGGTHVQLIQRDGADGRAVHGEGVARVAREVREGVRCHRGAHVHLRITLLTAVILQTETKKKQR